MFHKRVKDRPLAIRPQRALRSPENPNATLDTLASPADDLRHLPIVGALMDVVVWLRSLGLGKYEAAFRENEIDETVLPSLTAENLKELGVAALGHRRKLLDAIAALRNDASVNSRRGSTRSTIGCNSDFRTRRGSRWRASTYHGDVLRSCGFDQHLCWA